MGEQREGRDSERAVYSEVVESLKDSDIVNRYRPSFLGRGGEQLVFELEGRPQVVAKVVMDSLKPNDVSNRNALQEITQEDRLAIKRLKKYFGDSVLPEKQFVINVPVSQELLRVAGVANRFDRGAREGIGIVRIQERVPVEVLEQETVDPFQFGYLEKFRNLTDEEYREVNAVLIDGEPGQVVDIVFYNSEQIRDRLNDPGYKNALKEFAERAIQYTNETGEVLDLAGQGNVHFYNDTGQWKTVLLDARYPGRGSQFEVAQQFIKSLEANEEVDEGKYNLLVNVLDYVRKINLAAELTGSPERLRLSEQKLEDLLHQERRRLADALKPDDEQMKEKMKMLFDFLQNKPEQVSAEEHLKMFVLIRDRFNDRRIVEIVQKIAELWERESGISLEKFTEEVRKFI